VVELEETIIVARFSHWREGGRLASEFADNIFCGQNRLMKLLLLAHPDFLFVAVQFLTWFRWM
jgi:hypothetical protein